MKKCFDFSYQQSVQKWSSPGVNYPLYMLLFHKQMGCYYKMLCLMTRLTVISYLIVLQEKESVNQCIKDLKAMAPA